MRHIRAGTLYDTARCLGWGALLYVSEEIKKADFPDILLAPAGLIAACYLALEHSEDGVVERFRWPKT